MVKHIILWTFKDEYTEAEKEEIKKGVKAGLEGLAGKVPGMLDIRVNINPLETSNCDAMLDSSFADYDALKGYSVFPEHVEVATTKIRPHLKSRVCMDYEVE